VCSARYYYCALSKLKHMLEDNENNQGTEGGGTSRRGFASMDEDKQREIASRGGKAAHQKGTAHEFDSAEAAEAGRKGGQARQANRQSESDSEE
jgi:uncharacterized protein